MRRHTLMELGEDNYKVFITDIKKRLEKTSQSLSELEILVVGTRYNEDIVGSICTKIKDELKRLGVKKIYSHTVPGALELPFFLNQYGIRKSVDGMIAVGCVLRGETYHFEIVANESARGIGSVQLQLGIPIINSVLTCENPKQALERASYRPYECVAALLEMLAISAEINITT